MATFAIFAPSCAGDFDLRSVDGDELNVKPIKKKIETRPATIPRRASNTIEVSNALGAEIKRDPSCRMSSRNFCRSGSARKMASRAEVSITIVREPLGVVTEDLVLRAVVLGGQCIYAVKNVVDLLGKNLGVPAPPEAL
jgi:hypothetical protein